MIFATLLFLSHLNNPVDFLLQSSSEIQWVTMDTEGFIAGRDDTISRWGFDGKLKWKNISDSNSVWRVFVHDSKVWASVFTRNTRDSNFKLLVLDEKTGNLLHSFDDISLITPNALNGKLYTTNPAKAFVKKARTSEYRPNILWETSIVDGELKFGENILPMPPAMKQMNFNFKNVWTFPAGDGFVAFYQLDNEVTFYPSGEKQSLNLSDFKTFREPEKADNCQDLGQWVLQFDQIRGVSADGGKLWVAYGDFIERNRYFLVPLNVTTLKPVGQVVTIFGEHLGVREGKVWSFKREDSGMRIYSRPISTEM